MTSFNNFTQKDHFTLNAEEVYKLNQLLMKLEVGADKGFVTFQMEVILDLMAPLRNVVRRVRELERMHQDAIDHIYSSGEGEIYQREREPVDLTRNDHLFPSKQFKPPQGRSYGHGKDIDAVGIVLRAAKKQESGAPPWGRTKLPNKGAVR